MIPARDPQELPIVRVRAAPEVSAAGAVAQPAAIATPDGRYVTGGVLERRGPSDAWVGTLRRLDRPGVVATTFFGDRIREVVVRLDDGRSARARITGTTFVVAAERVCELRGLEPFA